MVWAEVVWAQALADTVLAYRIWAEMYILQYEQGHKDLKQRPLKRDQRKTDLGSEGRGISYRIEKILSAA